MDTLLLVQEAAGPLSVRCLASDRVALPPRFSVRPAGACLAIVVMWRSCSGTLRLLATATSREGREVMEKLLLTPEEAAAALGICRSKLYELLQAGVIESVHIGASRRIPVAAMVEYVERLRQEAVA
jgi:excisionase family DNA binding protein